MEPVPLSDFSLTSHLVTVVPAFPVKPGHAWAARAASAAAQAGLPRESPVFPRGSPVFPRETPVFETIPSPPAPTPPSSCCNGSSRGSAQSGIRAIKGGNSAVEACCAARSVRA
ncbi:hypothetical protein GCM10009601_52990 [Streptomyces thermospinosisporus]|uniref:Uncharacterized protein n=1 Tax=Streptomyces thermospinosisporus TaxID=161482 RepID=A0ABP4JY42_9ACTN